MTALCLNAHAGMQHAHTSIKVQKKLPVKKKDVGKHACAHHRGKSTLLTPEPTAIVCTTLQGLPTIHKKRFPRTYSTYPHPVLNDDFATCSECLSFYMSEISIMPLFSLSLIPCSQTHTLHVVFALY